MQGTQGNPLPKPIQIRYEDDCYIVFEKPAGLLVIPSPKRENNTLLSLVNRQLARKETDWKLHPCHRLDQETSGLILFAKGKKNQQLMMEEFKRQRVKKIYIAFIQGQLRKDFGEIRSFIKDFNQKRFNKKSAAKLGITRYTVLETKKGFSVLEVTPVTGRTNQIRIHFSEIGHPLLGERKYAFGKDYALKFRRTALHASSLKWIHPIDRREVKVESILPEDMRQFLNKNKILEEKND